MSVSPEQHLFVLAYRTYYGTVYRYVVRRVRDHHLASDLTQDVFLVAWRRRADMPDEPRAWLLAVSRRVVLAALRGRSRAPESLHTVIADLSPTAHEVLLSREELTVVSRALEQLPKRDREVILLHAWENLSNTEIGQVVGCSPATAAVRLHRARRRLAALCDAQPAARRGAHV